jgi:hypothetical protein
MIAVFVPIRKWGSFSSQERRMTLKYTQTQKLTFFILTMSVYGLATLFSEMIPTFHIGIFELSVEYFLFIPLSLAMLLDPLSVALGAAVGEIVFSEIMLGQFGGLGEMKKFLTLVIGIYIAGRLVRDPRNRKMIGVAALSGCAIQLALSSIVDIFLVKLSVDSFDTIPGLPDSVVFTETFEMFNDLLVSGIFFCLLPTLHLVPRLYGKIEPLMGVRPRIPGDPAAKSVLFPPKIILLCTLGALLSFGTKYLAQVGFALIDWEADWSGSMPAYITAFSVVVILAAVVIGVLYGKRRQGAGQDDQ